MIHSFKKALGVSALGLLISSQAYAIFGVQGFVGSKTTQMIGDLGGENASANHFKVSAHINPVPLPFITVGLGLTAGYENYELSDQGLFATEKGINVDASFTELQGFTVGPELYVGVSIPGIPLEPFAKLAYNVSAITAKADVVTTDVGTGITAPEQKAIDFAMGGVGLYTSIGVAFSPLPLVAILAEYEFGESSMTSPEVDTVAVPSLEGTVRSDSILLGAQISI